MVWTAQNEIFRQTAEHSLLDHKRNEEILEELHVTSLEESLQYCVACNQGRWFSDGIK
jgi:ribosomal protein S26